MSPKNCPRCKGFASVKFTEYEYSGDKEYVVFCTECLLSGQGAEDRDDAIKWWNERVEVDDEDVITDALKRLILSTPSGKYRNQLCDVNILWQSYLTD
jgi:hypothetical protein